MLQPVDQERHLELCSAPDHYTWRANVVSRESTLDIDRLAGRVLEAVRGISDAATARAHVEAALRRVWNTRGAVDIATVERELSTMMGAVAAGPSARTWIGRCGCWTTTFRSYARWSYTTRIQLFRITSRRAPGVALRRLSRGVYRDRRDG
jgi:hypothetical protein